MSFVNNKVQQRSLERLTKKISFLEKENETLINENKNLKSKISSYEAVISNIQNMEDLYKNGLEDIHALKVKYAQAISETTQLKSKYQKEMKNILKKIKKEI